MWVPVPAAIFFVAVSVSWLLASTSGSCDLSGFGSCGGFPKFFSAGDRVLEKNAHGCHCPWSSGCISTAPVACLLASAAIFDGFEESGVGLLLNRSLDLRSLALQNGERKEKEWGTYVLMVSELHTQGR
ncbi:hypothetical protein SERLA73DRAFT_151638 [Serpula lacrymans var. lacrymans S7.3]|uniref:Secreted protein n=1 Tax=Serpula lacrymans var. lacrymans (strain S7.3) TaxID=936435 RepID=F8PTU4_SERL3|nr:hypothetical protein SERLA73DRAFT_151638 [Serpula lacrymans var. lacrymans S7.3]